MNNRDIATDIVYGTYLADSIDTAQERERSVEELIIKIELALDAKDKAIKDFEAYKLYMRSVTEHGLARIKEICGIKENK